MNIDTSSPTSGGSGGPYSPSRGYYPGPQFSESPHSPHTNYNRQTSYGSVHSNASGPPGAPGATSPISGPSGPTSPGSYTSPGYSSPGYSSPLSFHKDSPGSSLTKTHQPQTAMPDAVLNMAAKGPPEKKPWAYAPDMSTLKEQREKVRRR